MASQKQSSEVIEAQRALNNDLGCSDDVQRVGRDAT
jgi:hypothetical protein